MYCAAGRSTELVEVRQIDETIVFVPKTSLAIIAAMPDMHRHIGHDEARRARHDRKNGIDAAAVDRKSGSDPGLAAVDVFEADDVVLAQVGAGLDFDDLERDLAGILEAVLGADRDIGGFVLGEEKGLLAASHPRGAAYDDPVLGAVVVHLQ